MSNRKLKYPKRPIRRTIKCPLYGATVHIHLGTNYEDTKRDLNIREDMKDAYERPDAAATGRLMGGKLLLWIATTDDKEDIRRSIQHETGHLALYILNDVGIEHNKHTLEAFQYYHEYWYAYIKALIGV